MKKIIKGLGLTVPLFAAIGIEVVVTIYCIMVYYQVYLYHGILSWFSDASSSQDMTGIITDLMSNLPMPSAKLMQYLLYFVQIMWAICFFFWFNDIKRKSLPAISKMKSVSHWKLKSAGVIFLLAVGLSVAIGGLVSLILPHFDELSKKYEDLMNTIVTGSPVMIFISTAILAPIAEELIFRGVILNKALRFAPFAVANFLQALLFGIFHMNLVQGCYAFVIGLFLGYVAYTYKTPLASMFMHFVFNGLNFVIPSPAKDIFYYIYVVIGAVLTVIAMLLFRHMLKEKLKEKSVVEI